MVNTEWVIRLNKFNHLDGKPNNCGDLVKIGILTVSDRASQGEYLDEGGPAILEFIEEEIESELIRFADDIACSVIVTTGGTGPAQRDVTPEATIAVCDRILDGFGEQMRAISLQYVPTAILSRQVGGTRGKCLIFNLPGRPKAIRETIDEIWRAVPYCVDLIGGPYIDMDEGVCDSFRPKDARRR
jgi:molybdopterin adenylyltransferase